MPHWSKLNNWLSNWLASSVDIQGQTFTKRFMQCILIPLKEDVMLKLPNFRHIEIFAILS